MIPVLVQDVTEKMAESIFATHDLLAITARADVNKLSVLLE